MVKPQEYDSTEEKILAAAKKVFLAKGLDGARMQDIADEAGINKALLHYYFRNKDKLFEQIFTEVVTIILPKVKTIFESDCSLFGKIELFCKEYITQIIKTPYVPIFILNEINRHPEAFLKKVFRITEIPVQTIIKQIKAEIKRGVIKPIEPIQLLMNTLSLCLFPFVAMPMIRLVTGMSKEQFTALMEQRKTEVPKMIIASIKK
jgi:TetR/AcrR family transcriptional regulator